MKMTTEERAQAWWTAGRRKLARAIYQESLIQGVLTAQRVRELLDGLEPGWKRRSDLGGLPEPGP